MRVYTSQKKSPVFLWSALLALASLAGFAIWQRTRPPQPLARAVTIAGSGVRLNATSLSDPFGLAIGSNGELYATDGLGNGLYLLRPQRSMTDAVKKTVNTFFGVSIRERYETIQITSQLEMPSALAVDRDGTLIVANTGAHTIVRVDPTDRRVKIIAGRAGISGFQDGAVSEATFNAPIGVTLGSNGAIYVADTYNDCIRVIRDGRVMTLAGTSEPGFRDGKGSEARFDTPCGIAVNLDDSLLIADTGNQRIRRVTMDGTVTTIAGSGEAAETDGAPLQAAFFDPTAIAIRDASSFYVADSAGNTIRLCESGAVNHVSTVAGGWPPGLGDNDLANAKLNRPTGLALIANWKRATLFFADSGNGLVRALVNQVSGAGQQSDPAIALLKAEDIRNTVAPRWPFHPPESRREIAGTFGEVRGEMMPEHDVWFHSGLDIPGGYGEKVYALHTERVTRPLSVANVGSSRELIRLPLLGYIHLRIGRDQNDVPLGMPGVAFRRDENNKVTGVRVRRGTQINAGDALGTLNSLNHVHLVVGPTAGEINALAALRFPGITDTIAPVIENVTLLDENWQPFTVEKNKPPVIRGRLRIIVRAYDQADGNAAYRRLGLYKLSHALLHQNGTAVHGLGALRENIVFDKLPLMPNGAAMVYATGSQSGYQGRTIFDYIATNTVRDGQAQEGVLDVSSVEAGNYLVRVIAEDFFGNKTPRDVAIRIEKTVR